MRSISLRMLFLLVAASAFCVVVLVQPSLFWSRLSLTTALVFVGWSLVLAISGNGVSRRFGVAAAIFAGGYLGLVFYESPSQFGNQSTFFGRVLITHQGLEMLAPVLGHSFPIDLQDFSLWDQQMFAKSNSVAVGGGTGTGGGGGFGPPPTFRVVPGPSPSGRYQQYLFGGHSLLAIGLGSLAGIIAARCLGNRENAAAPGA